MSCAQLSKSLTDRTIHYIPRCPKQRANSLSPIGRKTLRGVVACWAQRGPQTISACNASHAAFLHIYTARGCSEIITSPGAGVEFHSRKNLASGFPTTHQKSLR